MKKSKLLKKKEEELKKITKDIPYKENICKLHYYKLQIYEKEFKHLNLCDNIFNIIFDYALICAICFKNKLRVYVDVENDEQMKISQKGNTISIINTIYEDYDIDEIHWYYIFGGIEQNESALVIEQERKKIRPEQIFKLSFNLNEIFGPKFKLLDYKEDCLVYLMSLLFDRKISIFNKKPFFFF